MFTDKGYLSRGIDIPYPAIFTRKVEIADRIDKTPEASID